MQWGWMEGLAHINEKVRNHKISVYVNKKKIKNKSELSHNGSAPVESTDFLETFITTVGASYTPQITSACSHADTSFMGSMVL